MEGEFWKRFPGYENAAEVPICHGDFGSFLDANRPCVFPGACSGWKAISHFAEEDNVLKVFKDDVMLTNTFFGPQGLYLPKESDWAEQRLKLPPAKVISHWKRKEPCTVRYEVNKIKEFESLFSPMRFDPLWHPAVRDKSDLYITRGYFYCKGFSDWHFHPATEHITVQIRGTKEFILMEGDANNYSWFKPLISKEPSWHIKSFPAVRPKLFKAILKPGDAIYIPPLWWHLVVPLDEEIGLTVAVVYPNWSVKKYDILNPNFRHDYIVDVFDGRFRYVLRLFFLIIVAFLRFGIWSWLCPQEDGKKRK